ncbi:MAG: hypothetical protein ABSH51_31475 [Solirubrobacteraceae bacterium]|jgi:hypothetical protein
MSTGVFCIENWSNRLTEHASVLPLLEFMAPRGQGLRYIHRQVDSGDQLNAYVDRWSWLESYPLGYFALHGSPGHLYVGNDRLSLRRLLSWSHSEAPRSEELSPEELGARDAQVDRDWLSLRGKVLYVGSCATLGLRDPAELDELRINTGATDICGYTKDVRWHDAAAFDLILLSELAEALELVYPRPGVQRALRRISVAHAGLVSRLGFVGSPATP